MSDLTDASVSSQVEADIDALVEKRVQEELAKRAAAAVEAQKSQGYVAPVINADSLPSWYPTPAPVDEEQDRRIFPRGTSVAEVIEYDRIQANARAEAEGGAPKPLPMGTVTASAAEFLAGQR